jgi:aminopeptidase-like protein
MKLKATSMPSLAEDMYELCVKLFPICRSITGNGVRQTLDMLCEYIPLTIHEVPTGTKVFDWTVPREWNIHDAYVEDENGRKVIDFKANNLHVVGYSIPIDRRVSLAELQEHLYSLPDQPDAIPYITSYYKEHWGFCISNNNRLKLNSKEYYVKIDSELKDGSLTYGEYILKGESNKEVFLSTYICHPSMANNELSGPVVTAYIGKWLKLQNRRYTYRIIIIPETIGSITYLSRNLQHLKQNVFAGFNISCIGDERDYSFVSSRYGTTLADRVVSNVLSFRYPQYTQWPFLERGSDERQYCSPGVDLPLVSISRSKYGTYPEYHTSLDNLELVTALGLLGGYEYLKECIYNIENNKKYKVMCYGEPQLGRRGLYPNLSTKSSGASVKTMMDFIAYADGTNDLIEISNIIKKPVRDIVPIAERLVAAGLLEEA